jgi:hypothetical protein
MRRYLALVTVIVLPLLAASLTAAYGQATSGSGGSGSDAGSGQTGGAAKTSGAVKPPAGGGGY